MFTTNLMLLMPVIGVAAGLVAAMLVVRSRDLRLAPLAFNARNSRVLVPQYTKEGVMIAMALPLALVIFGSSAIMLKEYLTPPPPVTDRIEIPWNPHKWPQPDPLGGVITTHGTQPMISGAPTGGVPKPVPENQAVAIDAGTQSEWAQQANAGTINPDQLKSDSVRIIRDDDFPKGFVELAKAPELVRQIDPVYPSIIIKAGGQGRAYVIALLDVDGHVIKVELSRSSGYPALDEAALDAVKQWVFTPAIAPGGRPTRVWQMCPISFKIN